MSSRWNLRRRLVGLCTVGFATAVLAAGAMRGDSSPADGAASLAPAPLPVELVELRASADYPIGELYAGRVVSRRVSELGFERSGRLVHVAYDQGQRVAAGAVLARLDTRELEARRRELVARRQRIAAELALARSTTERRQRLHRTGVLATQRLDETVYAQQSLESQLAAAVAAIEHLDVQLALSELRAPFDGILAERFADEGTVLPPGAAVLRLLEAGALEVHVGVPPASAARLEPGSLYAVEVEGTDVEAVLETLLPTVDPETRTLTAVFRLDEPPAGVRHGALARIRLEGRVEAAGFWVPLASLAEGRRGLWTAYVAVPGGVAFEAERRQIEVIHAEADRAFVRGALYDGDLLVASGVHRIAPGMPVRPVASEG